METSTSRRTRAAVLDTVRDLAARAVAAVILFAAVSKAITFAASCTQLRAWLPDPLRDYGHIALGVVIILEVAVGGWVLCMGRADRLGLAVLLGLAVVFTVIVIHHLAAGVRVCDCFGASQRRQVHAGMWLSLVRNLALCGATVFARWNNVP